MIIDHYCAASLACSADSRLRPLRVAPGASYVCASVCPWPTPVLCAAVLLVSVFSECAAAVLRLSEDIGGIPLRRRDHRPVAQSVVSVVHDVLH